jgi:4'-phosphopantetheinyl transferase
MPVCFRKHWEDETKLIVWEITEKEDFFTQQLSNYEFVSKEIGKVKHFTKRLQYLASRLILLQLLGENLFSELRKNENGKLYLIDHPDIHLSVSHSGHYAAVVVSNISVGVDIQEYDRRLLFLSRKFVSESEKKLINKNNQLLDYHVIWGSKEAIFKAWGDGGLDFKENIEVFSGKGDLSYGGQCHAILNKGNECRNYQIWSFAGTMVFLVVARELIRTQ